MKTKEELAEKVGMQFDEVAELFSEETLNSMQMMYTVGGANAVYNCQGGNCQSKGDCGCFHIGNCVDTCKTTPGTTTTTIIPNG